MKVDFNRWCDEDESEPEMDNGFPNMLSQMSNFNDFNDENMDGDVDSDDEGLYTF